MAAASQAQMFDISALSYGLVHVQVRPNKLWGLVTIGITAQGLNLDIGHLRHIRWVKDDDPQSAINNKPELTANGKMAAQNRWITYNTLRGQYASAMEQFVYKISCLAGTRNCSHGIHSACKHSFYCIFRGFAWFVFNNKRPNWYW